MILWFLVVAFIHLGVSTNVRLGKPETIVNGRSLRVEIQSDNLRDDHRVTMIVACSSIDMPFLDHDPKRSDTTGCNSPGFHSEVVFPSATSLFKARQRSRSLFMRRRLVVRESPIVYLQVHFDGGKVLVTQYRVPEKVVPLISQGADEVGKNDAPVTDKIEMDPQETPEVTQPGQMKWYEFTGAIAMGQLFLLGVILMGIYYGLKKSKRVLSGMGIGGGSYAEKRQNSSKQLMAAWVSSAMEKGVYTQVDNSGGGGRKKKTDGNPLFV